MLSAQLINAVLDLRSCNPLSSWYLLPRAVPLVGHPAEVHPVVQLPQPPALRLRRHHGQCLPEPPGRWSRALHGARRPSRLGAATCPLSYPRARIPVQMLIVWAAVRDSFATCLTRAEVTLIPLLPLNLYAGVPEAWLRPPRRLCAPSTDCAYSTMLTMTRSVL